MRAFTAVRAQPTEVDSQTSRGAGLKAFGSGSNKLHANLRLAAFEEKRIVIFERLIFTFPGERMWFRKQHRENKNENSNFGCSGELQ